MGPRPIHLAFAFAFALASTLLVAPRARGAPPPDSIPSACGSRDAFDAELRTRLGAEARLSDISVAITPRSQGFHLRVIVGAEQRELEDPSCSELFRAAIVIAVSMRLEGSAAAPAAPSPAAAPPARRSRPDFGVGLGAGVDVGTLPKPVLALELEGKALWRWVGVGAHLRYLPAAERLDEAGQGAKVSALGAGVTGIFRPSPTWEARLGVAAQRLSGHGVGLGSRYSADVWAAGPTLGLGWFPLRQGALRAGLGAEGQLNLVRGRFEIRNYSGQLSDDGHVVFRVPTLAAGAFVRLGWVW